MRYGPFDAGASGVEHAGVKVVIDANVFVSAAIQRGPSRRIVDAWLEGDAFEVVACPRLLTEVREVLTERPRLRRWIELPVAELFVDRLAATLELVPDPGDVSGHTRDPRDDYLITLARVNLAALIVSGDRDLIEWKPQRPPVLTPAAFADLIL